MLARSTCTRPRQGLSLEESIQNIFGPISFCQAERRLSGGSFLKLLRASSRDILSCVGMDFPGYLSPHSNSYPPQYLHAFRTKLEPSERLNTVATLII